jgi:hypothetical protein
VREALDTLPAADREVLVLTAWEQLTPGEIGVVLGVPAATVRTRPHRARTRLRRAPARRAAGQRVQRRPAHLGDPRFFWTYADATRDGKVHGGAVTTPLTRARTRVRGLPRLSCRS